MAKRPRKTLDLPPTSAETRAVLDQLLKHRENATARNRVQEDKLDQARKIRIAARLVRFVRRDNSAAKKLLDQIFNGLRDGDRPLFVGWDIHPPPPSPAVPISDRYLPRTLPEIDEEIRRLEAHLEKRLAEDEKEDKRHYRRRMTIVGGALLGLVKAGSAEADAMLDTILEKIPKKERKPFDDWKRPRLPAANRSTQQVSTSQAAGSARSPTSTRASVADQGARDAATGPDTEHEPTMQRSLPAASPDARKDEKTPAASHAGQPSTTAPDGNDQDAAAKRSSTGSTSTRTSVADEGARDAATGPDTGHEPIMQSSPPPASPDARKDEKTPAASPAGRPSTTASDDNDHAATAKRGGKGPTSTRASITDEGARGAGTDSDAVPEPTIPSAPD